MLEIKYISATSLSALEEILNSQYLNNGYSPVGNVTYLEDRLMHYVQAVIKPVKEPRPTISLEPPALNKPRLS
jgi:hypothetical protein